MADQRLTDKTALTAVAQDDFVHVVDVSDTSANAAGTSKKVTVANLKTAVDGGGEVNTASNIGVGVGVFKQKVGANLEFKSLQAGNNITTAAIGDDVFISYKEAATYSATSTAITTLDLDTLGDSHYQILTVNTDIQFSNTPVEGVALVKTLEVISTTDETLGFSTATKVIGEYVSDGTTVNLITINFANYPTVGLRITVMINQ